MFAVFVQAGKNQFANGVDQQLGGFGTGIQMLHGFFPIMDPRPFVANMERVDSSA